VTDTTKLLHEIQQGSLASSDSVTDLLRRCQLLASRIELPELASWVQLELNGYPNDAELPSYRVIPGHAKGHFIGAGGSGLRNATLPAGNLPAEWRSWAREGFLRQSIGEIESLAKSKGKGSLVFPWPGDLVARVQGKFYPYMNLAQAWLEVSQSSIHGAVEAVRNRILSFAIAAEKLLPAEGAPTTPEGTSALTSVFHTHIYGGVANLAQGSSGVVQNSNPAASDFAALVESLHKIGVPESDIEELRSEIQSEAPQHSGRLGPRTAGWVGRMIGKAASGTWKVALDTATTILPKLIGKHFGIDPEP
jgi:AbiTii